MKGWLPVRDRKLKSTQHSGNDKPVFHHSKCVPDTSARPASEWEVREMRQLCHEICRPAFRFEAVRFVIMSRRAMDGPLRNREFRASFYFDAAQLTGFDNRSTDTVGGRIKSHDFAHHPIDEFASIARYCLLNDRVCNFRVACKKVECPTESRCARLMPGEKHGHHLVPNLLFTQRLTGFVPGRYQQSQ